MVNGVTITWGFDFRVAEKQQTVRATKTRFASNADKMHPPDH